MEMINVFVKNKVIDKDEIQRVIASRDLITYDSLKKDWDAVLEMSKNLKLESKNNEFNFYDKASGYFPAELRGYLEGLFSAQQQVFGVDMLGDEAVLPSEMIREINQYMKFELSGAYNMDIDSVIRDILRKKVTQMERKTLLEKSHVN